MRPTPLPPRGALANRATQVLREVTAAEDAGEEARRRLDDEEQGLRRRKAAYDERLAAAEEDRRKLFTETQSVEAAVRGERQRKLKAQNVASHYRQLLRSVL